MAIIHQYPGNLLMLTQRVNFNPKRRSATSNFQPHHTVSYVLVQNPRTPRLTQTFTISQSVTAQKLYNRTVVHQFQVQHRMNRIHDLRINQNLVLQHLAERVKHESPRHTLNLAHSVQVTVARPVSHLFIMTSTATYTIRRNLSASNVLSLVNAVSGFKLDPRIILGEIPPIIPRSTVTLEFGTRTLELPSPDFGNKDTIELTRINRYTRGGDLVVFRDPKWPKNETLTYTFSNLKESQSQALLQFIAASLGQDITIKDYDTRTWIGYIVTPNAEVLQPNPKYGSCGRAWQASFDFRVLYPYDYLQYVRALYQLNLGRLPATWEQAAWVQVLDVAGRLPVASGILKSAEARTFLVKSWYTSYLGRSAVNGEEQGHVTDMVNGVSEEDIQARILGSDEWYTRAQTAYGVTGTSDERFIKSLFVLLLNRQPSGSELTDKLAYLATNGRILTALNVVGSFERRQIVVGGYYTTLLQRTGSASEINGWANTGLFTTDIRIGFTASLEYYNLVSV